MAKTLTTTKANPVRPFYAAVGGVDVAVALARTGISDVQNRLAKVEREPKALVDQGRTVVQARIDGLVAELSETVEDINEQYVGLAVRGRNLVSRIRRQQATEDLKAETKSTTARVKTTTTQTKKAASTVKSSAKATRTAAQKTAAAATKAAADAAAKTGTTGTSIA
jgi:cobalamin biosynthesis Mg chelatase CobN